MISMVFLELKVEAEGGLLKRLLSILVKEQLQKHKQQKFLTQYRKVKT